MDSAAAAASAAAVELRCSKCRKVFGKPSALKAHVRRTYCQADQSLKSKRVPLEEVRRTKTGDKYVCPDCGRAYGKLPSLKYHMASQGCSRQSCRAKESGHRHRFVNRQFRTFKEASDFIKEQELDAQFFRRSAKGKNVYYACKSSGSRGGRESKKVPPHHKTGQCPAKFTLNCKKRVQDESGCSGGDAGINNEIYTIKGCLAHSHAARGIDEKTVRVSEKTRRSIMQLLALGIPPNVIKEKHLQGGGLSCLPLSGKMPRNETLLKLQRQHFPAKPDLSCSESDSVSRYMQMKSVRAFNLLVQSSPSKQSSLKGNVDDNEDDDYGSILAGRAAAGLPPKAVKADNLIIVFMDEHQRRVFRDHPLVLIIHCVVPGGILSGSQSCSSVVQLYSLMVMDDDGDCVPVSQALSAADTKTTARILMETLVGLEPSSSRRIKKLMSSKDEHLVGPFIKAVAQYAKPDQELIPIRYHCPSTGRYDRALKRHLTSKRLDQLVYAVYRQNEAESVRDERKKLGLRGSLKALPILSLERLHHDRDHDPPQHEAGRFEEGTTATTRPANNPFGDWGSSSSWHVTQVDSEFVAECCDRALLPCDPKTCRLLCSGCCNSSSSSDKSHLKCAHALICSCPVFNSGNFCKHVHLQRAWWPKELPDDREEDASVKGRHRGQSVAELLLEEEKYDRLKELASKRLASLMSGVLNKSRSLKVQSLMLAILNFYDSTLQTESMPRLDKCLKVSSVLKKKKGSRQKVQEQEEPRSCPDDRVAKFVISFDLAATGGKCSKSTSTGKSEALEWLQEAMARPDDDNHGNKKCLHGPDEPVQEDWKRILGANAPLSSLMKEASQRAEVNKFAWCVLLCCNQDKLMEILNGGEFSSTQREDFLAKLVRAKSVWECGWCHQYPIDSILTGYVECTLCGLWFHRTCCSNLQTSSSDHHHLPNPSQKDLQGLLSSEGFYACETCCTLGRPAAGPSSQL